MAFRPITVTTAIEQVAADNPKRRSLGFFNNGTSTYFVSTNRMSVAAEGWPVDPGAGVVFLAVDGDDVHLAHFAAASAGSQDGRVQEGFGQ